MGGEAMNEYEALFDAIVRGDARTATQTVETALASGADPERLVNGGMIAAMDEVGRRFEAGAFFIPELLIAARAMKACLALVKPLLTTTDRSAAGCVVIGTVAGDQHDIGKNLVAAMLEGAGVQIVDLGFDVGPAQFVEAVHAHGADILGMSALLTTTMPAMPAVIEELDRARLRASTKVMIGGAPITPEYARQIGADGYAPNAAAAVKLARSFLKNVPGGAAP